MPARFDSIRCDAVTRTPSGALRVPGVLTRPGVFPYTTADGRVVREWRPEEEVLRADSLATLEDAPVTFSAQNRHPRGGVAPSSYGALTVGHVRAGTVGKDPATSGAAAELQVGRADAIGFIQSRAGQGLDISCGYDARTIDPTPGIVPAGHVDAGKPYDRVQRDIVYNHVLILEAGKGRLGRECGLRLDSADDQIDSTETLADSEPKTMKLVLSISKLLKSAGRADAADVTVDGDEAKVQAAVNAALTEANALVDALKARADAADGRLAALDAATAKAAREALTADARKVLGAEFKTDAADGRPLSDREIKLAVVAKLSPGLRVDSKESDAYVDAAYKIATATAPGPNSGASVITALNGGTPPAERTDAADLGPGGLPNDPIARAKKLQAGATQLHLRGNVARS